MARLHHSQRRCFTAGMLGLWVGIAPLTGWAQGVSIRQVVPTASEGVVTQLVRKAIATGFTEYRQGNLEVARQHFLEAWELRPYKGLAMSLAEIEMKLGLYLEAAQRWQWFLEHSDDEGQNDAAREQLEECLRHIGRLHLEINIPGSTVLLGDTTLHVASTSESVLVEPGRILLYVEHPDYLPYQRVLDVTAGQTIEIDAHLAPRSLPRTTTSESVSPVPPTLSRSVGTSDAQYVREPSVARTVVLVSGITLTTAALVTGGALRFKSLNDDHEASLGRKLQADDAEYSVSRAKHFRALSDASLLTGGAFGLATFVTWMLWPETSVVRRQETAWTLQPLDAPRGSGLQLSAQF